MKLVKFNDNTYSLKQLAFKLYGFDKITRITETNLTAKDLLEIIINQEWKDEYTATTKKPIKGPEQLPLLNLVDLFLKFDKAYFKAFHDYFISKIKPAHNKVFNSMLLYTLYTTIHALPATYKTWFENYCPNKEIMGETTPYSLVKDVEDVLFYKFMFYPNLSDLYAYSHDKSFNQFFNLLRYLFARGLHRENFINLRHDVKPYFPYHEFFYSLHEILFSTYNLANLDDTEAPFYCPTFDPYNIEHYKLFKKRPITLTAYTLAGTLISMINYTIYGDQKAFSFLQELYASDLNKFLVKNYYTAIQNMLIGVTCLTYNYLPEIFGRTYIDNNYRTGLNVVLTSSVKQRIQERLKDIRELYSSFSINDNSILADLNPSYLFGIIDPEEALKLPLPMNDDARHFLVHYLIAVFGLQYETYELDTAKIDRLLTKLRNGDDAAYIYAEMMLQFEKASFKDISLTTFSLPTLSLKSFSQPELSLFLLSNTLKVFKESEAGPFDPKAFLKYLFNVNPNDLFGLHMPVFPLRRQLIKYLGQFKPFTETGYQNWDALINKTDDEFKLLIRNLISILGPDVVHLLGLLFNQYLHEDAKLVEKYKYRLDFIKKAVSCYTIDTQHSTDVFVTLLDFLEYGYKEFVDLISANLRKSYTDYIKSFLTLTPGHKIKVDMEYLKSIFGEDFKLVENLTAYKSSSIFKMKRLEQLLNNVPMDLKTIILSSKLFKTLLLTNNLQGEVING